MADDTLTPETLAGLHAQLARLRAEHGHEDHPDDEALFALWKLRGPLLAAAEECDRLRAGYRAGLAALAADFRRDLGAALAEAERLRRRVAELEAGLPPLAPNLEPPT